MSRNLRIHNALSEKLKPEALIVENESNQHNVPEDAETHFKIVTVSRQFTNLSRIERHRLVNAIVAEEFQSGLHALSLHLYTPQEWEKKNDEGKASQTHFKLLENYEQACWVEASPKTGRTHQIRVHSTHLGHPIVGDEKYGGDKPLEGIEKNKQRLYLHARSIQFNLSGQDYKFQADLDERFSSTLSLLRLRSNSHE
jgi:23S rRNA-/tRNA-specific pseudouridylate synthase